jgi:hypothetical protein
MLTDRRVLVVEPEFLIALEIQRLLERVSAAEIVFTRSIEEAAGLEPRFAEFDLAVVAMGPAGPAEITLTTGLVEAGIAVVGTTAGLAGLDGLSADLAIPLVEKPFTDEKFLTACAIALASTPTDDQANEVS